MEVEQGGGGAVWVADSPHRSPAALSAGVSSHRLGGCNIEEWERGLPWKTPDWMGNMRV